LDICLARIASCRPVANAQYRMKLAIEFLRNNPTERDPIRRLCEYLQISATALKDLFHKLAGESPKQFVLRWRMQAARAKLETGHISVKQVAYELGYQHPHDFSRAFKRFFGATASHYLPAIGNEKLSRNKRRQNRK
jgi:AraC-like DNA-binding protein